MKKKAIKIAASTAVAASALVAAAPAQQADAATNVDQLVQDAQNAGTVLKWAISVEGSADGKTAPWSQYNATKNAVAKAEAAIAGLGTSEKLKYEARLVEPKTQVKRAQAYIDAITSGEKIVAKNEAFKAAVASGDLDKVEAAYHVVTEEFRKQTILNYRVYGQSTRQLILDQFKTPIEKSVRDYAEEVTVHMLAKGAAADIKANKLDDASKKIAEAQALLDDNVLTWESQLQKSVDDVAASLPLAVKSVTRVNNTTVTVLLNKPVNAVEVSEFSFDGGLAVTSAVLGADGKTVTLTTTAQAPGKSYTLTYKGTTASFTTPAGSTQTNVNVDQTTTLHREVTDNVAIVATFKEDNGQPSQAQVRIDVPVGIEVVSVNGVGYDADNGADVAAGQVFVTPNNNGQVTIVVTAEAGNVAQLDKVITFNKMFNDTVSAKQTTGKLNFYVAPTSATLTDAVVTYVDAANNYFVATNGSAAGQKYKIKSTGDVYQNEGTIVSPDGFKSALSVGDKVSGTYSSTTSSNLNITFNSILSGLSIDAKFNYKNSTTAFRLDDNTITLSGRGQAGYEYFVYKATAYEDADGNPATPATPAAGQFLGKGTVSSNGTWAFTTNVDQKAITDFVVVQQTPGLEAPTFATAYANGDSLKVHEGPFEVKVGTLTQLGGDADGVLLGDSLAINNDSENGNAQDKFVVGSGTTITLKDNDGTTVVYRNGSANGTVFSGAGTGTLNIKFGSIDSTTNAGSTAGLQGPLQIVAINGVTNDYGLKVNVEATEDLVTGY